MADLRETFLYFAYGSNMLTRRLSARTPSAVPLATAYAEGYRLTFDKVSTDGSGKCDIEVTGNPADRVWGVLFRIATAEAADLDDAEGVGHGYRKGELEVMAATARSRATAYFATEKDPKRLPIPLVQGLCGRGRNRARPPARIYCKPQECRVAARPRRLPSNEE